MDMDTDVALDDTKFEPIDSRGEGFVSMQSSALSLARATTSNGESKLVDLPTARPMEFPVVDTTHAAYV